MDTSRTPILLTTAAAVAGLWWWKSRRTTTQPRPWNDTETALPLLSFERGYFVNDASPINTLTWFRGNPDQAYAFLEKRLQRILAHNPWLAGRLEDHQKQAYLVYNAEPKSLPIQRVHDNSFRRGMPLTDQPAATRPWRLTTNLGAVPVFRVTLVSNPADPDRFAVIVSLSHAVGDGHTYYILLRMLFSEDPVTALIVDRIDTTEAQQRAAMGPDFDIQSSLGFVGVILWGEFQRKVLGRVNQPVFQLLDTDKVKELKKESLTPDVEFVSTNDVLTSWYFTRYPIEHGFMVFNCRGRLEGHTDHHAGNYHHMLYYHRRDFERPSLIRQSLTTLRRVVTSHTPWVHGTVGIATNWSGFAQANEIPGCQEDLHIPVDADTLPTTFEILCLFRAGPGRTGVFVSGACTQNAEVRKAPFVRELQ